MSELLRVAPETSYVDRQRLSIIICGTLLTAMKKDKKIQGYKAILDSNGEHYFMVKSSGLSVPLYVAYDEDDFFGQIKAAPNLPVIQIFKNDEVVNPTILCGRIVNKLIYFKHFFTYSL